jgi:excisionase family DNA binding protein
MSTVGQDRFATRESEDKKSMMSAVAPVDYIGIDEVCRMVKASRATIYRWMARGTFPLSRQFGVQMRRWERSEIEAWRNSRPVAAIGTSSPD